MCSDTFIYTSEIDLIGKSARSWLFPGQRGSVLAAVTKATYLLTKDDELVWLATAETPMQRRCIRVSVPLLRSTVGTTFVIKGQSIEFESGVNLDFQTSRIWESSILPIINILEQRQLSEKLLATYEALLSQKTPVGFGTMLQFILQMVKNQALSPDILQKTPLVASAWPIVKKIAMASLSHDFASVLRPAQALIGLGEGLTPSGDDFLGGMFFGWYLLSCAYPQFVYLGLDIFPGWIDSFRSNTNLISFNLLKDNALGQAPEPLNLFGITLLTDQSMDRSVLAASELMSLGHSTGWDMLTGFLVGMLLAYVEQLSFTSF
jgi:hypothetical protein